MGVGLSKISNGEADPRGQSTVKSRPTVERHSNAGAANTTLVISTPTGNSRRLLFVTVTYSTAVTENVTVLLNSGHSTTLDNTLATIALTSNTDGSFVPSGNIIIADDDTIDVTAPAGGVGVSAAIAIYTERI